MRDWAAWTTLLLNLGLLLSSQQAQAEFVRFNEESNLLVLNCVRIPLVDNATYGLQLSYNDEQFHLDSLARGEYPAHRRLDRATQVQASVADRNIILTDRNASRVPKIVALFETPEVELVLVGVSHLIGDDSGLALMADMGFQVSRY